MRIIGGIVLTGVLATNPCNPPPPPPPHVPTTYTLATDGSDANPGTLAAPWATLGYALPKLQAGDVLELRGGVYYQQVRGASIAWGTETQRITVRSHPGEHAVLQGVLWLGQANYWTLTDLEFRWDDTGLSGPLGGSDAIVAMTNGVGWEILDSEISGAHSFAGLSVYGTLDRPGEPNGWRVAGNCIHDTFPTSTAGPQDHNVYVNTGLYAGSGVVEDNLIFGAANGSNVKLGWEDWQPSGAVNVTVRHNTLANGLSNVLLVGNTTPGAGVKNVLVERNLIFETLGAGNRPVRGVSINNLTNVALDNAWFDAEESAMILDYPANPFGHVVDGGGNFEADPGFDAVDGCAGFGPTNPAVLGYGRRG